MSSRWKDGWYLLLVALGAAVILGLFTGLAIHESREMDRANQRAAEDRRLEWEGPCKDMSWLLATTAGSPSGATCPNKLHRMQVQVASQASNEEGMAIVFCKCEREEATAVSTKGSDPR